MENNNAYQSSVEQPIQEDELDIQKELEAKFDELFGPME